MEKPEPPRPLTPVEVLKEIVGKLESGDLNITGFVMVYYQTSKTEEGRSNTSITTVGLDMKDQLVSAELLKQFAMDRLMGRIKT